MATWFDDGDPAEQPVEDPPVVIYVPFLSVGGGTSKYCRGGADPAISSGRSRCVLDSLEKNSRSSTAAWFEDGNPAHQPDEDPPAAIHVPLVSRAAVESKLHRGRRHGQRGGLLCGQRGGLVGPRRSNHSDDRPVAPNSLTETTPAVISVAAREGVGEVTADDDLGGRSRAACGLLGPNQISPPAEVGSVSRLCIPPIALAVDGAPGLSQSHSAVLGSRVQDVPVAIPAIERVRAGEVDREVSYSLFILPDLVVISGYFNFLTILPL